MLREFLKTKHKRTCVTDGSLLDRNKSSKRRFETIMSHRSSSSILSNSLFPVSTFVVDEV